jgi:hypothetical protein
LAVRQKVNPLLHRVIATLAERVTAENTAQGEDKALRRTVFFNGLDSILGTGGNKTTGRRQERGKGDLIKSDEP